MDFGLSDEQFEFTPESVVDLQTMQIRVIANEGFHSAVVASEVFEYEE